MVSLFPQDTWRGRKHGLRKDLIQSLHDLGPKFLRFPGGCIAHGAGLENQYNWKDTVGDIAERKPNWNLWGYHQTYGLGYYEYFLLCEDLGAAALPVISVGVSCGFQGPGVECVPMDKLDAYIQHALDLVEFANGPIDSKWGALRAKMGHPAPFNLEYVCLGNEEHDTPEMRERFPYFVKAFREKYPNLKLIGNSGLSANIPLYDLMTKERVYSSDEHYYELPEWFLRNQNRFDSFDRAKPKNLPRRIRFVEQQRLQRRRRGRLPDRRRAQRRHRRHDRLRAALRLSGLHPVESQPDLLRSAPRAAHAKLPRPAALRPKQGRCLSRQHRPHRGRFPAPSRSRVVSASVPPPRPSRSPPRPSTASPPISAPGRKTPAPLPSPTGARAPDRPPSCLSACSSAPEPVTGRHADLQNSRPQNRRRRGRPHRRLRRPTPRARAATSGLSAPIKTPGTRCNRCRATATGRSFSSRSPPGSLDTGAWHDLVVELSPRPHPLRLRRRDRLAPHLRTLSGQRVLDPSIAGPTRSSSSSSIPTINRWMRASPSPAPRSSPPPVASPPSVARALRKTPSSNPT